MAKFTFKRGDAWSQHFVLQDASTGALISLVDDAGPPIVYVTVAAQIRRLDTNALALELDSDAADGYGGLTVSEHSVRMDLTAVQTAALATVDYGFDLKYTWADGTTQRSPAHTLAVKRVFTDV